MNMKRILFITYLIICTLSAVGQDLSNSIEYGQIYIVGDATPASWDLGKADGMTRIADGVFEWTGRLAGGKDFKFMNNREAWHKHIVAAGSNLTVGIGEIHAIEFYADWALDGNRDCKFRVAETGNYAVVVDLTSMRMTVKEPVETAQWPDKFYLSGTATDNRAIEISNLFDTEFKQSVRLKPGSVKLMDTPTETEQTTYYVPRFSDVDISFGEGFYNPLYATADRNAVGWSVMVGGDYTIYLDLASRSYMCRKYRPASVLYLVGGCCERAWNYWDESNCLFFPDPADPEVMVWEGELRIGWDKKTASGGAVIEPDEPDKFKILTAQDWFRDTYHPYVADAPAIGESSARISGGDDLKWTIEKDGMYRLELNTRTEVLKGVYLGPSGTVEIPGKQNAGIEAVDTSEQHPDVCYYNLQGMKLYEPSTGVCIKVEGRKATKLMIK